MKIVLVLALACAIAACVSDPVAAVSQGVCTEEDTQNDTCGDPGGGSPQPLIEITEEYRLGVLAEIGDPPVAMSVLVCLWSGTTHVCGGTINVGAYTVRVNCWRFRDEPQHICESSIE